MASLTFAAKIRSGIPQSAIRPYPPWGPLAGAHRGARAVQRLLRAGGPSSLGAIRGRSFAHPSQTLGFHGPTSGNRAGRQAFAASCGASGVTYGRRAACRGFLRVRAMPCFFRPTVPHRPPPDTLGNPRTGSMPQASCGPPKASCGIPTARPSRWRLWRANVAAPPFA